MRIGIGQEGQSGTVQRRNNAVNAFAVFGIRKTVFFGRNQHGTGAITEFDCGNLRGAGVDAFGADCRFQITAYCIGIGMLEQVGLGDDKGVGGVTDDFKFFGVLVHIDLELGFHFAGGVAAGGLVVIGLDYTGDSADASGSGRTADQRNDRRTGKQERFIKLFHNISIPFQSVAFFSFGWCCLHFHPFPHGKDFQCGGQRRWQHCQS